jgi:hypothetical protein
MFETVIAQIDRQIAQLQQAKALLGSGSVTTTKRRGRPAGSKNRVAAASKRRTKLSAAGRKAIAEAQRKRWAAIKASKKRS